MENQEFLQEFNMLYKKYREADVTSLEKIVLEFANRLTNLEKKMQEYDNTRLTNELRLQDAMRIFNNPIVVHNKIVEFQKIIDTLNLKINTLEGVCNNVNQSKKWNQKPV